MPDTPLKSPSWSVNPVALAELIIGRSVKSDKDSRDLARARKLLITAFRTEQLEDIFEVGEKETSPLDLFQELANTLRVPSELAAFLEQTRVKEAIHIYGLEAMRRVLPYLVPVTDAFFSPPGAGASPPSGIDIGSWQPVTNYAVGDLSYLDPEQGDIFDCYLVSSMIALAWSVPAEWATRMNKSPDGSGRYKYTFFDGPVATYPDVMVAPSLPYNADIGKSPCARSSTDPAEGWPGLLEKAYMTLQRRLSGNPIPSGKDPTPLDYWYISENRLFPHEACQLLAGGAKYCKLATDVPSLCQVVRTRCAANGDQWVTTEPTMAWTAKNTGMMHNLGWKQTALNKNHSYAVLGIMKPNQKEFVVLRNPWGTVLLPKTIEAGLLVNGTWKPDGAREVRLGEETGIFGLWTEWFDKALEGVCWVNR